MNRLWYGKRRALFLAGLMAAALNLGRADSAPFAKALDGKERKYQLDNNQYEIERALDLLSFDLRDLQRATGEPALDSWIARVRETKNSWRQSFRVLWPVYVTRDEHSMAEMLEMLHQRRERFIAEFSPLQRDAEAAMAAARRKHNVTGPVADLLPAPPREPTSDWLQNRYLLSIHNGCSWVYLDLGVTNALRYLGNLGFDLLENNSKLKITDEETRREAERFYDPQEPLLQRYDIRQIFWPVARGLAYPPDIGSCPPYPEWSVFDPGMIERRRRKLEYAIELFGKYQSFAGFQLDEVLSENKYLPDQAFPPPGDHIKRERQTALFNDYLAGKYDAAMLRRLGLAGPGPIRVPDRGEAVTNKVLWMEYQDFIADTDEKYWAEVYRQAHALKPDCIVWELLNAIWYVQNPFCHRWSMRARHADVVDVAVWQQGSPNIACWLDLLGANARGPVSYTPSSTKGGSAETLRREFAMSTAHARANHVFTCDSFFMNSSRTFRKSKDSACDSAILVWDSVVEHCERIGRIEPYLAHTRGGWPVALLYSERSSVADGRTVSHFENHVGLYRALTEAHIGFDTRFADSLAPGQLDGYKVLILTRASVLTDAQVECLRAWVGQGGFLIATGGASLCDRWGRPRENYLLQDVLGVNHVKPRQRGKLWGAVRLKGDGPEVMCNSYESDVVAINTASIERRWADTEEPAVTFNKYGQGACLFLTACFPGLSLARPKGALMRGPRTLKFHEGFKPFLTEAVQRGLTFAKADLPLTVVQCPASVEIQLRIQERPGRRMIHLINHSLDESPVRGIELALPLTGAEENTRVFYGDTGEPVAKRVAEGHIKMSVRDLDVYDLIVIEHSDCEKTAKIVNSK